MSEMLLNDLFSLDDKNFEDKYKCSYPAKPVDRQMVDFVHLFDYIVISFVEHIISYNFFDIREEHPIVLTVEEVLILCYYCQGWHLCKYGTPLIAEDFYVTHDNGYSEDVAFNAITVNHEYLVKIYKSINEWVDMAPYYNKQCRETIAKHFTKEQRDLIDMVVIEYCVLNTEQLKSRVCAEAPVAIVVKEYCKASEALFHSLSPRLFFSQFSQYTLISKGLIEDWFNYLYRIFAEHNSGEVEPKFMRYMYNFPFSFIPENNIGNALYTGEYKEIRCVNLSEKIMPSASSSPVVRTAGYAGYLDESGNLVISRGNRFIPSDKNTE